jgi:hypothetical protein
MWIFPRRGAADFSFVTSLFLARKFRFPTQAASASLRLRKQACKRISAPFILAGRSPALVAAEGPRQEDRWGLREHSRARILSNLARRGVIKAGSETLLDNGSAKREPALAQVAAASGAGLAPADAELRRRPA